MFSFCDRYQHRDSQKWETNEILIQEIRYFQRKKVQEAAGVPGSNMNSVL